MGREDHRRDGPCRDSVHDRQRAAAVTIRRWPSCLSPSPTVPRETRTARLSGMLQLLDRTDIDGSDAGGWKSRGHCARFVHVLGLDEKESADLLLGLGERTICNSGLAVADLDR